MTIDSPSESEVTNEIIVEKGHMELARFRLITK
jgi:hypothetical protein